MKRLYYKCRVCPFACWYSVKTHNNDTSKPNAPCMKGITEPRWEESKYYHKD